MLSVDCDVKSVMKGIMHGAVDYLAKPVRLEELKLIWKHVARRSLNEKKDQNDSRKQLDHTVIKLKTLKNCTMQKNTMMKIRKEITRTVQRLMKRWLHKRNQGLLGHQSCRPNL